MMNIGCEEEGLRAVDLVDGLVYRKKRNENKFRTIRFI